MRSLGARSVVITANAWFFRDRHRLLRLAAQFGLATICEWGDMAADGCLIGYGPRRAEVWGRAAELVSRIFRGARAGDLPIEQPTKFDLAINLDTAKSLGLTIPPTLLARADEVIE
jgi:putative ABC transport system substrate-binding protein